MKKNLSTIVLVVIFFVGLSLLLYPSVSNYWNSFHQSHMIASYVEEVANMDQEKYDRLWQGAEEYNRVLQDTYFHLTLSDEEYARYEKILDVTGTGIMGYIDIPKIKCSLPIYHGIDEAVLQIAIGHIAGTSMPVGGTGTHCVLSGHRGLPSAKLFTEIDKLIVGDEFMIRTLDEVLTYEVDQILIVLPEETDALKIEKDKDLCTLVTCTPYGINTHRLLVRGHRVETVDRSSIRVTADAIRIEPMVVAPVVAAPILLALLVYVMISADKKKKKKR